MRLPFQLSDKFLIGNVYKPEVRLEQGKNSKEVFAGRSFLLVQDQTSKMVLNKKIA